MITLQVSPAKEIMPVYNKITFTVSSDNVAQCNFRYICDIYDANNIQIGRLKLFPDQNGWAAFDVNRILEDFVLNTAEINVWGTTKAHNSFIEYHLEFGEEYDNSTNCDAGTTIYPSLLSTSTQYAWRAALQYREWIDYCNGLIDFTGTTLERKFLTNSPASILTRYGSENELYFFVDGIINMEIITYDANNNLIANYTMNIGPIVGPDIWVVGVGPQNLNNWYNGLIIDQLVDHYEVYLTGGSPISRLSEIKTYYLDKRKSPYDPYLFRWLNTYGGFDTYAFNQADVVTTSIKRNEYNKLLDYNYSQYQIGDRGRTNTNIDATTKVSVASNWLTLEEAKWIGSIKYSPMVFVMDSCPILCFYDTGFLGGHDLILLSQSSLTLGYSYYWVDKYDKTINQSYDGFWEFSAQAPYGYEAHGISYGAGSTLEGGIFYAYNYTGYQTPIIVTSQDFIEPDKVKTKNLNSIIEFEYAINKNIQRN